MASSKRPEDDWSEVEQKSQQTFYAVPKMAYRRSVNGFGYERIV